MSNIIDCPSFLMIFWNHSKVSILHWNHWEFRHPAWPWHHLFRLRFLGSNIHSASGLVGCWDVDHHFPRKDGYNSGGSISPLSDCPGPLEWGWTTYNLCWRVLLPRRRSTPSHSNLRVMTGVSGGGLVVMVLVWGVVSLGMMWLLMWFMIMLIKLILGSGTSGISIWRVGEKSWPANLCKSCLEKGCRYSHAISSTHAVYLLQVSSMIPGLSRVDFSFRRVVEYKLEAIEARCVFSPSGELVTLGLSENGGSNLTLPSWWGKWWRIGWWGLSFLLWF